MEQNRSFQKAKVQALEQNNIMHRYTEECSEGSEERVSQDS